MEEKFKKFLINHNAYDAFCENLKNRVFGNTFITYMSLTYSPALYLVNAFEWDKSAQGFQFWDSLYEQWGKEVLN